MKKKYCIFFTILIFLLFVPLLSAYADQPPGKNNSPARMQEAGAAKKETRARVAIVIDDFGQQNNGGVEEILNLGIPVTCAVMPNMVNTYIHAEKAANKGHEIIVHLPLEPVRGNKKWLGPGAVTMKLNEEEVRSVVRNDFDSVPHAVGFNNHMGSAITSCSRLMRPILQVAKEKNFFVLDSRTTDKTTIPVLAQELDLPYAKRDVFLDNRKNVGHIKKQLLELSLKALKNGKAVGIGHVGGKGTYTARAIKEMLPEMEKMGIKFVYLSDIVYVK